MTTRMKRDKKRGLGHWGEMTRKTRMTVSMGRIG